MSQPGRGRPKSTALDYCPGLWWAAELHERTGLPLKQVAEIAFDRAYGRLDLGVFVQPERVNLIQHGKVALNVRSTRHKQMVTAIDAYYPGSSSSIHSITWDELRLASGKQPLQQITTARVHPTLRSHLADSWVQSEDEACLLLTKHGVARVCTLPHLDVLGILLMQRRLMPQSSGLHVQVAIGVWIRHTARLLSPFMAHHLQMLVAIESSVPSLGQSAKAGDIQAILSQHDLNDFIGRAWLRWHYPFLDL